MADGFNNGGDYSFFWFLALLGLSELGAYAIVRREWFDTNWHYHVTMAGVGVVIWVVLACVIVTGYKLLERRRK